MFNNDYLYDDFLEDGLENDELIDDLNLDIMDDAIIQEIDQIECLDCLKLDCLIHSMKHELEHSVNQEQVLQDQLKTLQLKYDYLNESLQNVLIACRAKISANQKKFK